MVMNKKQYNNVIENTLKHEQSEDSLSTARAIFDNMGVALPQGDMKTVYETIKTDNYMGWKSCTMQETQAAADNGTAAIGISEDRIVVLSANDEEEPVAQTASVMTLSESTSAYVVDGLQYYTYAINTCVVLPKITSSYLFGQAYNIPYPASSGYTGNAFGDNRFLTNVCGKSTSSTIAKTGCAVSALGMYFLYKSKLSASNTANVYEAVKAATIQCTDDKFDYYRRGTFTVNFAGKSITVNNPATNLISTYGDLSAVKSNLIAGKCVMLCLVTERGMHYVLADGLCVAASDLDSIKVADPADGKRKTLREAIDRATTGSPSASHVRTAYPLY